MNKIRRPRKGVFADIDAEGTGDLINTGVGVMTNAIGALGADDASKGQAGGNAIGGGIGAGLGMAIGGPMGAAVGQQLGSMVGGIIGGGSDRRRAANNRAANIQRDKMALNLMENIDPYGQFADGGAVDGGGGKPGPQYRDNYYEANAKLAYYKNILNDKLKAKNPQGFTDHFKGLMPYRTAGDRDGKWNYVENSTWNDYLSPKEVQETLGNEYDHYIESLQTVNTYDVSQGMRPLWGEVEGKQPNIRDLNYGRRFASLDVTPSIGVGNETNPNKRYARKYSYDPQTGVNYTEEGDLSMRPSYLRPPQNDVVQMEEGGAIAPEMMQDPMVPQPPQTRLVNIEKGELLTDIEGNILTTFDNPNIYSPHADNKFKEPKGNFVELPVDAIVIPKDKAKIFKKQGLIARNSIIAQILKEQALDPNFNDPDKDATNTDQFAGGGKVDPPKVGKLIHPKYRRAIDGFNVTPDPDPVVPVVVNPAQQAVDQGLVAIQPSAPKTFETPMTSLQQAGFDASLSGIDPNVVKPAAGNNNKLNWSTIGRRAMAFLPGLAQTAQSFAGDPDLAMVNNGRFDDARANIQQVPDQVNIQDQLADADRALAVGMNILGSNDPSARSQAGVMMANTALNKGKVRAEGQRMNTQLRVNKLAQLADLDLKQGVSEQQEQLRMQNETRMNKAANRNIRNNALSEGYTNFALMDNDDKKIEMINSITKFADIDPYSRKIIQEDPEAQNFIYEFILQHAGSDSLTDVVQQGMAAYTKAKGDKQIITREETRNGTGMPTQTKSKNILIRN